MTIKPAKHLDLVPGLPGEGLITLSGLAIHDVFPRGLSADAFNRAGRRRDTRPRCVVSACFKRVRASVTSFSDRKVGQADRRAHGRADLSLGFVLCEDSIGGGLGREAERISKTSLLRRHCFGCRASPSAETCHSGSDVDVGPVGRAPPVFSPSILPASGLTLQQRLHALCSVWRRAYTCAPAP